MIAEGKQIRALMSILNPVERHLLRRCFQGARLLRNKQRILKSRGFTGQVVGPLKCAKPFGVAQKLFLFTNQPNEL